MLNVAVEHELVARSPCVGLSGPRVEATEMRFLNAEEVQRVAEELPLQFRTLVYTAAYTGMRWGELIGLRRAHVDLAAPAITVVEQLVILDDTRVRKTPKTAAGRRRITLPGFLTELLAAHLEERAGSGPDGLVFPNRAGNPINPSRAKPRRRRPTTFPSPSMATDSSVRAPYSLGGLAADIERRTPPGRRRELDGDTVALTFEGN